jgi:uncharacterized membrane protein
MNPPVKALLLSALVFPGCGQLWLRRYRSGGALLLITIGALFIVIRYAVQKATVIANQIIAGEIPLDPQLITQKVSAIVDSPDSQAVNIAGWVIIACWVIGIIDAYRAGRNVEPAEKNS